VNFALDLLRKDVDYAIGAAKALGVPLATAASARDALDRAIVEGHGAKDMAAVVEPLRR
jgi:3-hydroxyisobutyrate dehydrogenase